MRPIPFFLFGISILALTSCAKVGKEVAEEIGLIPESCGSDGARIQLDIAGTAFCANANITAISDGTSASITGVSLLGNTFSIQVDSIASGTQRISEASNAVLFMSAGTPYVSVGDSAGWLTIDGYDASTHRLTAQFQARVFNEMNGQSKTIGGSVDVTCAYGE